MKEIETMLLTPAQFLSSHPAIRASKAGVGEMAVLLFPPAKAQGAMQGSHYFSKS